MKHARPSLKAGRNQMRSRLFLLKIQPAINSAFISGSEVYVIRHYNHEYVPTRPTGNKQNKGASNEDKATRPQCARPFFIFPFP